MCSPARCRICGKVTWAGCGDHIDQVKAMVPDEHWCLGHEDDEGNEPTTTGNPFSRLFSR